LEGGEEMYLLNLGPYRKPFGLAVRLILLILVLGLIFPRLVTAISSLVNPDDRAPKQIPVVPREKDRTAGALEAGFCAFPPVTAFVHNLRGKEFLPTC